MSAGVISQTNRRLRDIAKEMQPARKFKLHIAYGKEAFLLPLAWDGLPWWMVVRRILSANKPSLSCEYIRVRDCLSAYPTVCVRCGDDNSSLSANGVYYQLSICWWSYGWLSSWKPEVLDSQWDASKQMHEISECVPFVTPSARWKLRTGSFMFGRLSRHEIDPFYLLNKCGWCSNH